MYTFCLSIKKCIYFVLTLHFFGLGQIACSLVDFDMPKSMRSDLIISFMIFVLALIEFCVKSTAGMCLIPTLCIFFSFFYVGFHKNVFLGAKNCAPTRGNRSQKSINFASERKGYERGTTPFGSGLVPPFVPITSQKTEPRTYETGTKETCTGEVPNWVEVNFRHFEDLF